MQVALLTGGWDKPYALGMAKCLASRGVSLDVIGSDELDCPELRERPGVTLLNLRGSQRPDVGLVRKLMRLAMYYARLIKYAWIAKPRVFHILWNNKLEVIDRTVLMCYYKLIGKRVILTAHNVNAGKRDERDSLINRLTLKAQYRLSDHIFVHTEKMKSELVEEFSIQPSAITVIPFGINNAVPITDLSQSEARRRLGIGEEERTLLFFGNIAPYKGLEHLVRAFKQIVSRDRRYWLIIAGRPKQSSRYWKAIEGMIHDEAIKGMVVQRIEYIPDSETEVYFKAADVLVLPYRHVYQSGVLSLGYRFGLPIIAADVGTLRDEIIEGQTGFVYQPDDQDALARTIEKYFDCGLYRDLQNRQKEIRHYAEARYAWDMVGKMTMNVYAKALGSSADSSQVVPG